MFQGEQPPRLRDILDGTSNTLMIVLAGADRADVWTKPGGLPLAAGPPAKTLGNIEENFLTCFADGSVKSLSASLDDTVFRAIATRSGQEVVNLEASMPTPPRRLPSWIIRMTTDIDRQAVFAALKPMGDPEQIRTNDRVIHQWEHYALCFPDARTLVAAPSDLLPGLLNSHARATSETARRLQAGARENDFTFVADLQTLNALKQRLAGNLPMAGLVQSVKVLEASFDLSGNSESLQEIQADMQSENSAAQLSALLTGLMQMQKAQLLGAMNSPGFPVPPDAAQTLIRLQEATEIKAQGTAVSYRIPKPQDMDRFIEELKPLVVQFAKAATKARAAAHRSQRKNGMKQIGLAFHNYHDVYGKFPRSNGDGEGRQTGLSWRVFLLPFVDEANLYQKFQLDEPWDSKANLPLVKRMPAVFAVAGVDKPGHTSIHVFTGKTAPFGGEKDRGIGIRDFRDGTSSTILAVVAGPATATPWTKPGGLEFTGKNAFELLGEVERTFLTLLGDGSVREISADIKVQTLNNLIQHADGNPVDDF